MTAPGVYEFDDVRVDPRRMEITRRGVALHLEPKSFDVLVFLIEHGDRLVTKEELLEAVWKDTFVTPNTLTRAVAQLRKSLGDDAYEAKYIETVARRGYRFLATIRVQPHSFTLSRPVITAQEAAPSIRVVAKWRAIGLPAAAVVILIGAGVPVYRVWHAAHPTATSRLTVTQPYRLTVGSSSYVFAAPSPDGSRVAYSSDQSGSREIYVRGLATDAREIQITRDGQMNSQPAWSPDGQWLAYTAQRSRGIWIVSASGGVPRKVVDVGSDPAWSPDGKRLVYSSFAGALASQAALWTVNSDGTGGQPLTQLGRPGGGHIAPAWSHDGRLIAFVAAFAGSETGVYLMPAAGGEPWLVTSWSPAGTPHFSRDDRMLFLAGRSPSGGGGLLSVPVTESGDPPAKPETVLPLVGGPVGQLSLANDGTATVIIAQSAPGNIWAVDVPVGPNSGSASPLTFDDVRDTFPSFSPDGRRVAFTQLVGSGPPPTSWVMDADGRNREPLSIGTSESIQAPRFSSDGSRVLVAITGEGGPSFGWLTLSTRQVTRMSANGWSPLGAVFPALSPDDREVAYHIADENGVPNVWRHALDTGKRMQVTFDKEAMTFPVWSRDGKWLAVVIKRGEDTQLGVVSRDGGAVEQITSEPGQSWTGSWAPDNDQMAFAGSRDGVWNVYTVSRRTKQIRKLTNFGDSGGYVRFPIWSPTGQKIAFERATPPKGSIWTMKIGLN